MPIATKTKSNLSHVREDETVAAKLVDVSARKARIAAYDAVLDARRKHPRNGIVGGMAAAIKKVIAGEDIPIETLSTEEIIAARHAEFEALDLIMPQLDAALSDAAHRITRAEMPKHKQLVADVRKAIAELQRALLAEDAFRRELAARGGSVSNMPQFGRLASDLGIHGGSYSVARYALKDADDYLKS